ncbi:nuclear pore complex assembly-domain-containing protein [Thamnocephalis sphaerospora]|uniref:Nuclear pore complex assembly-domain-containing protein n=1 Tax=Thamnocephalis sphaerospora TaxID=78915 RepID=A0A4P9XS85_9FUNG|nr:nuclear pore complex assembly-domain-containing protein [Thamnocephalis sphaerospora]|eukprot:RKP08983.1 nuclear pore complex assembly-domain-containing protein [Thamnocephalis sphaerospora]
MDATEFLPLGYEFDASSEAVSSGAFGAGFAPGRKRPTWCYRHDEATLEVRALANAHSQVFARIPIEVIVNDAMEELEIVYVSSAIIAGLDLLLVCTCDRLSNETRLYLYDPYLGRSRRLPLPKSRSVSCVTVSEPFQLQFTDDDGMERIETTQLLLVGTQTAEMYWSRIAMNEDPFGANELVAADGFERLPECRSGKVTSIACYAVPADTDGLGGNTICIAWGTDRGKVLLVQYQFDATPGADVFHFVEAVEIEDQGPIARVIVRPLPNDEQGERQWLCFIAQHGTHAYGRGASRPLVSVCRTNPCRKQWATLGLVTPTGAEDKTGVHGRTLSVALLETVDQQYLYAIFNTKLPARQNHSTATVAELKVLQIGVDDQAALSLVETRDLTPLGSIDFMEVLPLSDALECSVLCADKIAALEIAPAATTDNGPGLVDVEIEDAEATIQEVLAGLPLFPHLAENAARLAAARQLSGGMLVIDRLLQFAEVEVGTAYPPVDADGLVQLVHSVYGCDLDMLKKDSIMYYLIRDSGNEAAISGFAQKRLIPEPYQQLVTGYWLLDHEQYERATAYLCMPTVQVDWPEAVVRTLLQVGRADLAWRFLQQTLWTPADASGVELQFRVRLQTDLHDALLFQRKYVLNDANNEGQLFVQLLNFCFIEKKSGDLLSRLMNTPFTAREESLLVNYCDDSQAPLCFDFLIMYFVHHGRYVEAIRLNELARRREDPRRAVSKQVARRNAIVDNLRLLLPPVQRDVLELQLEAPALITACEVRGLSSPVPFGSKPIEPASSIRAGQMDGVEASAGTIPIVTSRPSETPNKNDIAPLSSSQLIRAPDDTLSSPLIAASGDDLQKSLLRALADHVAQQGSASATRTHHPESPSMASPKTPQTMSEDAPVDTPGAAPASVHATPGQELAATPATPGASSRLDRSSLHRSSPFVGPPTTPRDLQPQRQSEWRKEMRTETPAQPESEDLVLIDVPRPVSPLPSNNAVEVLHQGTVEPPVGSAKTPRASLNLFSGVYVGESPAEARKSVPSSAHKAMTSPPLLAHVSPFPRRQTAGADGVTSPLASAASPPPQGTPRSPVPGLAHDIRSPAR